MNRSDIEAVEKDLQETFSEVGDKYNIFVKKLDKENTETNIYNESPEKNYEEPVNITGRISFNPAVEEVTHVGRKEGVDAVFSFTSKELKDKGYLDSENTLLLSSDDLIIYKEEPFNILNPTPSSLLGDTHLIYKFECKKVI